MTIALEQPVSVTTLHSDYHRVRAATEKLCQDLATEDFVIQSMPDISPTKWHLAHTSWFFESFVLTPHLPGYRPVNPAYFFLFNSYYVQAGERHCRNQRGYLSRPTVREVFDYRERIDRAMDKVLATPLAPMIQDLVLLGLNHEQQH